MSSSARLKLSYPAESSHANRHLASAVQSTLLEYPMLMLTLCTAAICGSNGMTSRQTYRDRSCYLDS